MFDKKKYLHLQLFRIGINYVNFFYILGNSLLLELTHQNSGDRGESWRPITKKVYWPPPGPTSAAVKTETTSSSVHIGKKSGYQIYIIN